MWFNFRFDSAMKQELQSTQALKVCFVTPRFGSYLGGAEISLKRLMFGLNRNSIQTIALTALIDRNSQLVMGDDKVIKGSIQVGFLKSILFSKLTAINWYKTLSKVIIKKLKYIECDVIYLNNTTFLQSKKDIEKIFSFGKPVILKITVENNFRFIENTKEILLSKLYRKQFFVHCISHEIQNRALKFGFHKSQTWYCPNPIDVKNITVKEDAHTLSSKAALVFTYVGRFVEQKNIDVLVGIFKKLEIKRSDVKLNMIGYVSHPEMKSLIQKLKKESGENITWVGKIPNKDIEKHLHQSNFFIMASKDEGMSNALLEAMAVGLCPVVPAHLSGMKELIDDGVSGILYDIDHTDALIERLRTISRTEASLMGKKARQKVEKLCNTEHVSREHIRFYHKILSLKNRI
jgi:glycosyltransferase involved in cell wall biosynthesis